MDDTLLNEIHEARAWLEQMLGQVLSKREWTMDIGTDPVGDVVKLDARLRPRLVAAGYTVPGFAEPMNDPLGNMIGWRDFLASITKLN